MASPVPESATIAEVATNDATTIVVPAPSGIQVGDLLLGILSARLFSSVAPPAGWLTVIYSGPNDFHCIWYKFADASDTVASDFTFTLGNPFMYGVASVHRISGAANPLSISHTWDKDSAAPYDCLTITPPAPDSLFIWGCACAQHSQGPTTSNKGVEQTDLSGGFASMSTYALPVASGSAQTGAIITGGFLTKTKFSIAIAPAPSAPAASLYRSPQIIGAGV
ncbi:hypothetical protein C5Y96_05695 [Blastopirellula marina]|uniref:Uncharacterized protein n=1 Tax=Blastopirellula marina TaxID=124 RepID=A0A2S8G4I4_9BACT|nr:MULTISPECIES: hypothetical protein [Pirellulaceae]PQO39347.1 hypothetical protein C5Y96_05695 [Blastopirellula marina]RCS55655.1 hypothetical protein DTL36_05705 [Bremerella cremea]